MPSVHVLASRINRLGGADVYTSELLKRLPSRGFDVTAICHEADATARETCRVVEIGRGNSNELPLVWRLSPALQLRDVAANLRRANLPRPDVVLGMAHQLIWAHRRVFGQVPMVYLPHSVIAPTEVATYKWGSNIKRAIARQVWGRIERDALNTALATIRFTNEGCHLLSEYYGRGVRARFEVVPQAIDIPLKIDRERRTEGPARLLSVGRLISSKNNDFLIRTLSRLKTSRWTLDILGDGEESSKLKGLVVELGLDDRVHFRGHIDPQPYYREADLVVAPSLLENASLVVLEAMASAVPTLTIRADGGRYVNANHEMVEAGITGFLADGEEDFAKQLAALIERPWTELRQIGVQAMAVVRARHSWDTHIVRLESILRGAATAERKGA